LGQSNRHVHETASRQRQEQPIRSLLERTVVGNGFQFDRCRQVGRVFEELLDAPIISVQKLLEHQARKELRLRVGLGTIFMGIVWQRELTDEVADDQHCPR